MSRKDVEQSLSQLSKLLADGSYINMEEFSALNRASDDKNVQNTFDQLLTQLNDFDYFEATATLNIVMERYRNSVSSTAGAS
jgi:hypothetical protein